VASSALPKNIRLERLARDKRSNLFHLFKYIQVQALHLGRLWAYLQMLEQAGKDCEGQTQLFIWPLCQICRTSGAQLWKALPYQQIFEILD